MKSNQTMFAAVGVLLIAGISVVVLLKKDSASSSNPQSGTAGVNVSADAGDGAVSSDPAGSTRPASTRAKERQASANADLIAKYGETRTNLSKHVSSNITGIMEDALQMTEMASAQGGGFGGGIGMALGGLNGELQMTPEQREKATAIYQEHQKRKAETYRTAVERLKKDPSSLMRLMLASDANARGEITDEEYKNIQTSTGGSLTGIINPLDQKNFGGGSPLRDPDFVSGLKGVLDPSQNEKLDATMAKRQSEAANNPATISGVEEGNIAGMQKMDLEKFDKSIESARKVTNGIKSMMDGMSGLRDIIPPPPAGGQ